jgi:carbon starvation protein
MSLALLALVFIGLLTVGYFAYGGWVARQFALDDRRATPASRLEDGVD